MIKLILKKLTNKLTNVKIKIQSEHQINKWMNEIFE